MRSATLGRLDAWMVWAPFAPVFVRARLQALANRTSLSREERRCIEDRLNALSSRMDPPSWACRFPVLTDDSSPRGISGGILTLQAFDPGTCTSQMGEPLRTVLDADLEVDPMLRGAQDLMVLGLPRERRALIAGRSGMASAWLALRARETGRAVPANVVVSADVFLGADGACFLGPVQGGSAKAAVVAREMPGARFLLCGEHKGASGVEVLEPGSHVTVLERLVWGSADPGDRSAQISQAAQAKAAFEAHDYELAKSRYREILSLADPSDACLRYEAHLRLAAIAIHQGRSEDGRVLLDLADHVDLPLSQKGPYLVERLAGIAGMHLDGFRPVEARAILESPQARHAGDASNPDAWSRIQVLGAWRRLHLLEGRPAMAVEIQRSLLELAEGPEYPRALLDLGWALIRAGDLAEARYALLGAREHLEQVPSTYRLQTRAFLAWYAGRLRARGGPTEGLDDLFGEGALAGMLETRFLQAAARWRLEVLRAALAADQEALRVFGARCTPFQRWCAGVFLLEWEGLRDEARSLLAGEIPDLSAMPELRDARDRLVERPGDEESRALLTGRAAY